MSTDANLFYDGTGGDGFSRKKIPTIEYQHAPQLRSKSLYSKQQELFANDLE